MNNKLFGGLLLSFTVLCSAFAVFYFFSSSDNTSVERSMQSQKSKINDLKTKTQSGGRDLELGTVLKSQSEVSDEPSALFNDPAIKQAWGLKKSDAGRAWSVSRGDKKVIVAVIDTGLDINHEDLKNNLWKNPGETGLDAQGRNKATNGIDDDGNGLVDDIYGWNFVSNNNKLDDNHGHGTHIAGIIGAEAGNKKGISGISPDVSLMILKYYDPKVPNTDNLKNTIKSIDYAVKMGAHIINYSGGGTEYSQEEHDAVERAQEKGVLFVAAAGNERSNSDEHHYYPADYKLSNIISVTAIDPTTTVLSSSNYGTETVDIAAPGQGILSCLPNSTYGLMTGTSQATAFVTGAAVLVTAHKDLYNQPDEIKKFILATGDSSETLANKTRTSRQLNLFKALTILENSTTASGLKIKDIQDKSAFSAKTLDSIDPNDKNQQEVNRLSSFGHDLIKALGSGKRELKKSNSPRLGSKEDPNNEN
ncbi:MAG: S8 family peptidase [Pseudobdellovibrio sp.]